MLTRTKHYLLQFCFYLLVSFAAAVLGYFIIKAIRSDNEVFGSLFRMSSYHHQHPFSYILIPCVLYSLIVTIGGSQPLNKSLLREVILTLAIVFFTILFSLPVGGMLYYYHDMRAGYFPDNWLPVMINDGTSKGFEAGWLIIALSFPYNVLGIVVCYFITKAGSHIFHKKQPTPDS